MPDPTSTDNTDRWAQLRKDITHTRTSHWEERGWGSQITTDDVEALLTERDTMAALLTSYLTAGDVTTIDGQQWLRTGNNLIGPLTDTETHLLTTSKGRDEPPDHHTNPDTPQTTATSHTDATLNP